MTIRKLLVDLKLYLVDGLTRRNLMSNRDAFASAVGAYSEQVIALVPSMSLVKDIPMLFGNSVTVLRSSLPIEVTVVFTNGESITQTMTNLMVLSSPVTSVAVRNTGTVSTDLIAVQI